MSLFDVAPKDRAPRDRFVVTGVGPIAPTGCGRDAFYSAHQKPESGLSTWEPKGIDFDSLAPASGRWARQAPTRAVGRLPTSFGTFQYIVNAGLVTERQVEKLDPIQALTIAAAHLALCDAGLNPKEIEKHYHPDQRALVLGTSTGLHRDGFLRIKEAIENPAPLLRFGGMPTLLPYSATGAAASALNILGHATVINSTSEAGTKAIVTALQNFQAQDNLDVVVTGGYDLFDDPSFPLKWSAFQEVDLLSHWPGRPQDACRVGTKDRSGMVPAEGAGFLTIERLSGVRRTHREGQILAEVTGWREKPGPPTRTPLEPEIGGETGTIVMQSAVDRSHVAGRLGRSDVVLLMPHLTGTGADHIEERSARPVLDPITADVRVTTCMTHTGHAFAATGSWNAILAALTLKFGRPPITLHVTPVNQDPKLKYPFIVSSDPIRAAAAVIHNYGFFNVHAALVIEPFAAE